MTWLEFDSLVNARDVGGIATTDGGVIASRRLIRTDNLQSLTEADIARFDELGVTDVVDLRSAYEVANEGPGPLVGHPGITFHHHSYLPEGDSDTDDALPWVGLESSVQVDNLFASHYLSYLADRPESVLAALRAIAYADGAAVVHCAAGKDRTGTTAALALRLAGAHIDQVVADYALSTERIEAIVGKLMRSPTYHDNLAGRPMSSHETHPETMHAVLHHLDENYGGVEGLLSRIGWTDADTAAMRTKLRG